MKTTRKTASYLNQLRLDLQNVLDGIGQAGEDTDASFYDLSKISPHDVRTDDVAVKNLFDIAMRDYRSMGKLLASFRIARDSYLEFF